MQSVYHATKKKIANTTLKTQEKKRLPVQVIVRYGDVTVMKEVSLTGQVDLPHGCRIYNQQFNNENKKIIEHEHSLKCRI